MLPYSVSLLLDFSILISVIISLQKLRDVRKEYLPFIVSVWVNLLGCAALRKNRFARQTLGFLAINNLIIMITRVIKRNVICGKKHSYHDNYGYCPKLLIFTYGTTLVNTNRILHLTPGGYLHNTF